MTYIVLDKKPKGRLYRITRKSRIPNPPPFFIGGKDTVAWWSDGNRLFLQVVEQTERTARDDKKQAYVRLKEMREHWYEVAR